MLHLIRKISRTLSCANRFHQHLKYKRAGSDPLRLNGGSFFTLVYYRPSEKCKLFRRQCFRPFEAAGLGRNCSRATASCSLTVCIDRLARIGMAAAWEKVKIGSWQMCSVRMLTVFSLSRKLVLGIMMMGTLSRTNRARSIHKTFLKARLRPDLPTRQTRPGCGRTNYWGSRMKKSRSYVAPGCAVFVVALILLSGCSDNPATESTRAAKNVPGAEGDARRLDRERTRNENAPPHVVPYLDSSPSDVDGQGTAFIAPLDPLSIGSRGDFRITFVVGEEGIDAGGYVMLQVSPWWGWSQPQTDYPEAPGYTKVEVVSDNPANVHVLPLNRVVVSPQGEGLGPGEKISFNYSGRVDKFAEAQELFQIFVDADGDGHSACIADPPRVRVLARKPTRLNVASPSQVSPGETIEIRAAPLDGLGNWSEMVGGAYKLKATSDGRLVDEQQVEMAGGEKTVSFSYKVAEEGIYFFEVEGPSEIGGKSNVMLCQAGLPRLNLYFGDIHGHSRISDGTGTPEDYYAYAREVSRLDIAALTDHADYGTIPVEGAVWERIKKAAADANEPGRFVTFLGFEWTNWVYGHRNVYYRDGDGPVFRSIDPQSDTPQEIWSILESLEAMTIAHHVGGGPVATDWSVAPSYLKEWLVEISSIHGSSEYYGGEAAIYNPKKGAFVRDSHARGYKLGIMASGDTHDGHPGQRSVGAAVGGIVGVYSSELTREAVWEAFRKRQVYGTSGPKIILNFRVADSPMGSELTWDAGKGGLPIAVRTVACDDIAAIEIIRNGEPVFRSEGKGVFAQFLVEDPEPPPGTSWYYARVVQEDGQMAWSSPVWVTVE